MGGGGGAVPPPAEDIDRIKVTNTVGNFYWNPDTGDVYRVDEKGRQHPHPGGFEGLTAEQQAGTRKRYDRLKRIFDPQPPEFGGFEFPEPPKFEDPFAQQKAEEAARQEATVQRNRRGRSSFIKTGGAGLLEPIPSNKKTLLGQ